MKVAKRYLPFRRLGEEAALDRAGYVSFGPFAFGHEHNSRMVTELLGTEPLLWIETAHFRIGCALAELPLKGSESWSRDWIKRTKAELADWLR